MQINTDVYPEVGYGSYSRWTNETIDYSASEPLEHSIFYSGTISENVQFCDENNYSYIAEAPNCAFTVTPREIVKGDIFFIKDGYRHFNFNGEWAYNNTYAYNIVTEFDISQFYFDLDKLTVHVYDLSQADGGHAIGNATTMPFSEYRNKTTEYKATHLIRQCSHNGVTSGADSFFKYKNVADYSAVNVVPMIRYVFNDKTTLYLPFCMLNDFANPDWQGPINLDSYTGFGKFGAAMADIYLAQYPYIGKWYNGWTAGTAAQRVTMANCGAVDSFVIKAGAAGQQVAQVNNGYQMPDISTIDTDKYCVPVFVWGTRWDKRIAPFYTDEFIMRYFASSGLRFKVDDVMYIGYMDANGQCNGNYLLEEDLADSDSANKNITDFTGSSYDANIPYVPPVPPVPGDDEDNTDPVSTAGAPFGTGLAHYYVTTVDSQALTQISEAMGSWDIDATKKDLYRNLISCKILKPPAGIPSTPSVFEIYGVKPQYNGADITIPAVNGNPDISFGPYTISRKFNDFRDYAPYTRAEIFLPYCGWCALPSHVVGRSVSVSYFTDVIAGTVKAVVFCEANPVAEAAGVMAYDIPFAAQNVGAKIQAANTGMLAYGKAALQLSAGIGQAVATKGKQGLSSIVNGAFGVAAGYNQLSMAANENYTEISGKAGDGCALAGIDTIIIKIVRPKYGAYTTPPYVPDGFAHTVGFLSMKQAKVSAASGLILCDNVDTSGIGKATDAERAEIKRVLETGLYVNNPPE